MYVSSVRVDVSGIVLLAAADAAWISTISVPVFLCRRGQIVQRVFELNTGKSIMCLSFLLISDSFVLYIRQYVICLCFYCRTSPKVLFAWPLTHEAFTKTGSAISHDRMIYRKHSLHILGFAVRMVFSLIITLMNDDPMQHVLFNHIVCIMIGS